MKWLAYGLLLLSLIFLADGIQESLSGQVEVRAPRSASSSKADRVTQPAEFRNLMNYQWARAGLTAAIGLIFLGLKRRSDRLDPFSPSFQGNASVDELGEILDEKNSGK
ncbi:hypothetical protein WJU23_22460 [Prosthecobacter sp. SYSU 5D2]|uniref:hypothetical protein n=1 Tax=Prosthecobacter sp. SYSU 5D2 TaxID=3134134 RepID=UPI0031FEB33A